jgi:REP element-mobilizing transposase RayT
MTRPRRELVPGGLYHVTTRGIRRMPIFDEERDRLVYLAILQSVVAHYEWRCFSFCLMPNHVHLVVQTPEPDLDRGMHDLSHRYAVLYNHWNGHTGHLFERRYWSGLIASEAYLAAATRYVLRNPVRAQLCREAGEYPWSSYAACDATGDLFPLVDVEGLRAIFGSLGALRAFVDAPDTGAWRPPEGVPTERSMTPGAWRQKRRSGTVP